jgi:hypothetical protein
MNASVAIQDQLKTIEVSVLISCKAFILLLLIEHLCLAKKQQISILVFGLTP